MTNPATLLVDNAVHEAAAEEALRKLNIRRRPAKPIFCDIQEHVDLLQEMADADTPISGQEAFYEAFGIELKEVVGIIVPAGFDESIRLPESIPHRFLATSSGTAIDMTQAPAA